MSLISRFASSALKVGAAQAIAQMVTIISLLIHARIFEPSVFGIWALIQSVSVFIGALATLRYELAVVLPANNREAVSILMLGLSIAFLFAIASLALAPFAMTHLINNGYPSALVYVSVPSLVFSTAATQLAMAWFTRKARFTLYGSSNLLLALLVGILPVILYYSYGSQYGLIVGAVVANAIVALWLWYWVLLDLARDDLREGVSVRAMLRAGQKHSAYPKYMTPFTVLVTLRERVIYFLIGSHLGSSEVGLYSVAHRLANAPNILVTSALRPVFFHHITHAANAEDASKLIEKIMFSLVAVSVPFAVVYLFFREEVLVVVLGGEWGGAGLYLAILLVPMIARMLVNWMTRYFDAIGRQRVAFGLELFFSITLVCTLFAAFYLGATAAQAVIAQAVVLSVYSITWVVVLFGVVGLNFDVLVRVLIFLLSIVVASWSLVGVAADRLGFVAAVAIAIGLSGSAFVWIVWLFRRGDKESL